MKLVYQYLAIFFIFSPSPNHLHRLQVKNCDSNSRLVVDEDDYGKFRLERVKSKLFGAKWAFNPYGAGIDFKLQNLTSVDVRLKSIPAL